MEEYEKLKAKFNLPDFQTLNHEFELSSIDPDEFLLRDVLKKMEARLEYLSSILEEILQPSPDSMQQMHEMKHFTHEQKEKVYELYKKIQYFLRACMQTYIERKDENYASLINQIAKAWPQLREDALPYIQKMKDSWNQKDELKHNVEYFG